MPLQRDILLVDDDDDIRDALSETLLDEGFSVHPVPNGREALAWLHEHPDTPCVVLLDLMMPVMDGWTFLRYRSADPALAKIPVVVITAEYGFAQLTKDHQVNEFVTKPIMLPRLLAAINGACGLPRN